MEPVKYRDFIISKWLKPIPDRSHDYDYVHVDYDGAEDSCDNRSGSGSSIQDCKSQIDEYWENYYSAMNELNHLKTC